MNSDKSKQTGLLVGVMLLLAVLVGYQVLRRKSAHDAALLEPFATLGSEVAETLMERLSAPAQVVVLSVETKDQPLLERNIQGFMREAKHLGWKVLAHETLSAKEPEFPEQSGLIREADTLALRQRYVEADVIVAFSLYPDSSSYQVKEQSGSPKWVVVTEDPYEAEKWMTEGVVTWVIAPPLGSVPEGESNGRRYVIYDVRPSTR